MKFIMLKVGLIIAEICNLELLKITYFLIFFRTVKAIKAMYKNNTLA